MQGAGILRGEAWFQDVSMRQGAGMTSWLMLTVGLPNDVASPTMQPALRFGRLCQERTLYTNFPRVNRR